MILNTASVRQPKQGGSSIKAEASARQARGFRGFGSVPESPRHIEHQGLGRPESRSGARDVWPDALGHACSSWWTSNRRHRRRRRRGEEPGRRDVTRGGGGAPVRVATPRRTSPWRRRRPRARRVVRGNLQRRGGLGSGTLAQVGRRPVYRVLGEGRSGEMSGSVEANRSMLY